MPSRPMTVASIFMMAALMVCGVGSFFIAMLIALDRFASSIRFLFGSISFCNHQIVLQLVILL